MYVLMRGSQMNVAILTVIFFNVVVLVYVSFNVKSVAMTRSIGADDFTMKILDPAEVPVNESIFFIETKRQTAVKLTTRQACSVESAARINPDRVVYVLFLSPQLDGKNGLNSTFSQLKNYHNVRFRHIDLYAYIHDTPIEDFVLSGIMEDGRWLVEQHSDMLRILTLWKFGGIYMDLDVVSLKPMPSINFIGAEYPGDYQLASSVIGMQKKDVAEKALNMFKEGWDGQEWVKNGPYLVTKLMKEQCGTDNVTSMYSSNINCNNFTIYPPEVFGPIAWYEWELFFDSSKTKIVKEKMINSMAVHFWNKLTKEQRVISKSNQPYAIIANESCPKVFSTAIDNF